MPKIKFEFLDHYAFEVCDKPIPAASSLPKWFKDMPPYKDNKLTVFNKESSATAKKCMPMLDAMSAGYLVRLWSDVYVDWDNGSPYINWKVDHDVFSLHGSSSRDIPAPTGYDQTVFKYLTWFRVRLPAGYSLMIQPASNRNPLPFMPVPAIVDSDKESIDSNIPVWISKDANGVIEAGTPIAQLIPFKRESWTSEFSEMSWEDYKIQEDKGFHKTLTNNYVRNVWSRKSFK